MSKTKKRYQDFYDDDDEDFGDGRRTKVNKHKEKRINHALKTKDIDELLRYDEDE